MSFIRKPAVAGMFYPADAKRLRKAVGDYLAAAARAPTRAKAIIAPHAGYIYSGAVAGSAYAQLAEHTGVTRVVLLGPSHRVPVPGIAASSAGAFETPLGTLPVAGRWQRFAQVTISDAAHAGEHSLEVQLPFLQVLFGEFEIMPLVVGDATMDEVADVLEALWGGPETLVVISSDLSHYHDYETARQVDARTAAAIERLEPEGLFRGSACGRVPIGGLLLAARRHRLKAHVLDLRSSGDTAGPRDQVVGYGAFAFSRD